MATDSNNIQSYLPPKSFNDYPRVSVLIDRDTRRWKGDVVRSLFLHFEARTILNIPLCHSLPKDQIIWVGNRKGEFSVKSAYYITVGVIDTLEEGESSSGDSRSPLWKKTVVFKHSSQGKFFCLENVYECSSYFCECVKKRC